MSLKPLMVLPIASSRTRTVQSLSLALWAMPVLASSFYLAVQPLTSGMSERMATGSKVQQHEQGRRLEYDAFHKPMATMIEGGAAILQTSFASRKGGKNSRRAEASAVPFSPDSSAAPSARVVNFMDVKIVGPNSIFADGMVITLADVIPPDEGSMCKRIDGVVESCAQRAEGRLAVLTHNRRLRCTVWTSVANDQLKGRCSANRLDLSDDLIRLGLGRSASS